MSVRTGLSPNPNLKTPKNNSSHRRNDSGELDVFEAARYFSSENPAMDDTQRVHRSARMSLDVPIFRNPIHPGIDFTMDSKKGKFKQPSSPGARLASFLNSLFSQTSSKKKKKSKSGVGAAAEEDSGRRKRRSSISHFRIITENLNSAAITPTKSCKEMTNVNPGNRIASSVEKLNAWKTDDQKSRLSNGSVTSFARDGSSLGFSDRNSVADRDFRKFSDVDDGADTDSSSDLFDLPNHELDFYSNGLPVYGTTNMDRIRIVAPISSTI